MRRIDLIVLGILSFSLLTDSVFAQETRSDPLDSSQPFELHRFTLDNGLRVWCQPRSDSKSVIVLLVMRAGARYESESNNGVSHFVEHMLFSGTEHWDENEVKDVISKQGGIRQAFTSREKTIFYVNVSARDFDIAMNWLSEVVFHPTFPEEKVENERRVIFQEREGKYGWFTNKLKALGFGYDLNRKVERAIFPHSTLTLRVIGEDKSLENIDRDTLVEYYRSHYAPNNAILTVVGGVTPKQVLEKSETYFGDLEMKERPKLPETPELPNDGPNRVVVRGPDFTNRFQLMMGARTVGQTHQDRWALDVLGGVLKNSLDGEIRCRRGLVYGLWAYNTLYTDAGYFVIYTSSDRANKDLIQKIIKEHLEKMRRGHIDPEKVAEAKTALKGRWALSMESNYSRASWLSDSAFVLPDDEPVPNYETKIDSVTPEDLPRVVKTYFTPQRSYVGIHSPMLTVNRGVGILVTLIFLVVVGMIAHKIRRKRKPESRSRSDSHLASDGTS